MSTVFSKLAWYETMLPPLRPSVLSNDPCEERCADAFLSLV